MKHISPDIERLGFDQWFRDRTDAAQLDAYQIARVTTVDRNSYTVTNGRKDVFAETTGKLMFHADSPLDCPAVGDWVYAQFFDDETFAVIHEILPRRSLLKRKTSGKRIEFQLIAANIDTALIMQSLDSNYNLRRLERYLVMTNEGNIHPVVLLSKSDLLAPEAIELRVAHIHEVMPDIRVVTFSSKDDLTLARVRDLLISGKTFCLLGSSGVGKGNRSMMTQDNASPGTSTPVQNDSVPRSTERVSARKVWVSVARGASP